MNSTFVSDLRDLLRRVLSLGFVRDFVRAMVEIVRLFFVWLRCLLDRMRGKRPARKPPRTGDCCIDLPPDVYKRADPLLYSQQYLMARGLAVTWDNPDIDVLDGGAVVSGPLKPDHDYTVRVRVWNGSYDAPALGVRVDLYYLSFGAQTQRHHLAARSVALGAKGTTEEPAFAFFHWTTPAIGGHYCLQAWLGWLDDANPDNNVGQKNVAVAQAHSAAKFTFAVGNPGSAARRFELRVDAYQLPKLSPCADAPPAVMVGNGAGAKRSVSRLQESKARWTAALREQAYGLHPVPHDWQVTLDAERIELAPGEQRDMAVAIEPLDAAFRGSRPFNVNVFAVDEGRPPHLVGGVTLNVVKA
jgi:hypothetical protein